MRSRYDWDQMNAFLDRLEVRIRYGKIELSKEPQLYANRFSYALEDGVVSESYDGHFYCPRQIIRTNDDNIALLAIYVFSQREEVFWDFPGVSSAAGREQRVRASRRVSIGEARPDSFFAQRRGDGEDDWFVGYQDGKEAVTFFSGLSWETALFYLEGFVQAEPGFDALFDRLRRETGIAPTERSVLLAIYLCGCGGTQLYGEQDVRREYPPEGAGRCAMGVSNERELQWMLCPLVGASTYKGDEIGEEEQDTTELGRIAVDKLIEQIEKPLIAIPEQIIVRGRLLESETVQKIG